MSGYISHGSLSRGAAISFYAVTSLAPVLLIVVAIAGLAFGQDAVRGTLVREIGGLLGEQGGELIQTILARSSDKASGAVASVIGVWLVVVWARGSSVKGRAASNRIGKPDAGSHPLLSNVRARAASLGLVAT